MILNRVKVGTNCTVKTTGQTGTVKQIYFYPTKYELEFSDGKIGHYSSKDLDIDGVTQPSVNLKLPEIPIDNVGEVWSSWIPFISESVVEHHFTTTKAILWKTITSLEIYNIWFHGIQRALPIIKKDRYVHKFSFAEMKMAPGAYFKCRPSTLAPWFQCRILTIEKEQKFSFTFKTNPLDKQLIELEIKESSNGVWLKCRRTSKGPFSLLSQFGWQKKSRILKQLETIVPKVDFKKADTKEETLSAQEPNFGGFSSRKDYIDYGINMGMEGNIDYVNSIPEKPIRGMVKAGIVKAKRTGIIPPLPEKSGSTSVDSQVMSSNISKEDSIAILVNKGLDGDMDAVNNHKDRVERAKAKAMMVKIKRGTLERPPMPSIAENSGSAPMHQSGSISKDDMIAILVNKGLDGDMDAVNSHKDRIERAKAKAMMVKIKRGTLERPPMPVSSTPASAKTDSNSTSETREQQMERLINEGLDGNMDEINSLDDRVLRGKVKAAIVKAKRAAK